MKWMKHLSYIFTITCTILGIYCSLSNLIFSENTDSENPYTCVQNTKHLYNLLADTLLVSTDLYQLSFLLDTFSKALKHLCGKVIWFGENLTSESNTVLRSASISDEKRGVWLFRLPIQQFRLCEVKIYSLLGIIAFLLVHKDTNYNLVSTEKCLEVLYVVHHHGILHCGIIIPSAMIKNTAEMYWTFAMKHSPKQTKFSDPISSRVRLQEQ